MENIISHWHMNFSNLIQLFLLAFFRSQRRSTHEKPFGQCWCSFRRNCLSDGLRRLLMSCCFVWNSFFHSIPPSTISFFFWFHWTQTTRKQAQKKRRKNLFSPIIFLLLDTFTQYNFKMPTSYFLTSVFFLLSTFQFSSCCEIISSNIFFFDFNRIPEWIYMIIASWREKFTIQITFND